MLFAPKSARGLRVDYPELGKYEELKALRAKELLFVWYYACKSSPLFNYDGPKKNLIERCIKASNLRIDDPAKLAKFEVGNFPAKIQAGIDVMFNFEPAARIVAKLEALKDIEDLKKMTSLKLDPNGNHPEFYVKGTIPRGKENEEGGTDYMPEIDMSKKQKYMDMVIKKNEKLGDMISKAEKGWGVVRSDKTNIDKNRDETGVSYAESFHERT
ncbi:MAG: hypothetical protein ACTSW1_16595 [Candidatus Hodarchaeales archaeon]